jgi:hypothetical protein
MSGRRSRNKGANGEREFAKFLTDHGFPAERGCQHAGGFDSPDVKCPSLPYMHHEVKRVERLDLWGSLDQAIGDAGAKLPVVHHRPNRRGWVSILRTEDLLTLLKLIQQNEEDQVSDAGTTIGTGT